MPRRYALSTLRTRCQQHADLEHDGHIANPEWDSRMSEVYGELFMIVVDAGDEYFQTAHTITATGADSYDEPDDHLSTICFDRIVDASGRRVPLEEIRAQDRHRFAGLTGIARYWALVDDQIFLYPNPSSGTYELVYAFQPPDLATYVDGDKVDVVNIYGEQFMLHGVAARSKLKSESDMRGHLMLQEKSAQKLMEWSAQRALSNPRQFTDGEDFERDWLDAP